MVNLAGNVARTQPTRRTAIWWEDILEVGGSMYTHCRIGPADVGTATLYTRGSQTFLVRGTLFRYAKYSGTSLM